MALTLLAAAVCAGIVFAVHLLVRSIFGKAQRGFADILLVLILIALTLASLIVNNGQDTPDPVIDQAALWLALATVVAGVFALLIDLLRLRKLRGSRGLVGIVGGLVMTAAVVVVPFAFAYLTIAATQTLITPQVTPELTEEAGGTPQLVQRTDRFNTLFFAVRQVVAEEIGLDEVLLFTELDEGRPLADIVQEHGGNVDRVVARIAEVMRIGIREAAESGEMNPIEAALLVSQMNTLIGLAVQTDIVLFSVRFGGPTPPAEGVRPSLLTLLTETPPAPQSAATPTPFATGAQPPTVAATRTPTPSP